MYHFKAEISKGAYGRVLKVEKDGQEFAIKEFIVSGRKHAILGAVHLKEVDVLKRCRHPFILQPVDISYTCPYSGHDVHAMTDELFVIMPLAIESLFEFKRRNQCTVPMVKRFMVQITQALAYLHAHKLCYRDVKSANILIFKDPTHSDAYNAVLCDLGMCKPLTNAHLNSEHVGTVAYKSPEVMLSPGRYTYSMDVWSLGVLFVELINMRSPFERQPGHSRESRLENGEVLIKIFKNRGSPDRKTFNKMTNGGDTIISFDRISRFKPRKIIDLFDHNAIKVDEFEDVSEGIPNFGTMKEFCDLLEKMLVVDPDGRIAMGDILSEPFFAQVPRQPDNEMWRGLHITPAPKQTLHVLRKIANATKRAKGLEVISKISVDHCTLGYRIMFLGLDLYDRCLLALEARNPQDETDEGLLAYTCCYIACKYFLDETAPDLRILFPRTTCYEDGDIIQMEKVILMELVQWEVYRPTVYDLLDRKVASPATLFALLKNQDKIYGHSITKIVTEFDRLVK